MGSAAINFSDLPKGATVVSSQSGAYSDLPSGATVVEPPKDAPTGFISGVVRGAKNIAVLPGQVYHAFTAPADSTEDQAFLAANTSGIPGPMALGVKRLLFDPQYAEWRKAQEETPQPGDDQWNNATERKHAHVIAALTPLVGPIASNLADRYLTGDKTGALGELLTYTEGAPRALDATKVATPAIVRGTARGINAAMENAPAAGAITGSTLGGLAGGYLGHESGLPGATGVLSTGGATAGAALGFKLGKVIQDLPRVPGGNFGLAPLPESTAPIPAGAYKTISQANPKLNDAQIRGVYQDYVASQVDSRVPAGPINDAATKVAAASPDAAHAQDVVAAAERIAQSPQLSWEDILDDRAWAEKMRNAQQAQEQSYWTYKGRLNRAASSADVLKGYLTSPEQAVGSLPAPGGTMEANKLLGYQNRPTIAQATAARNQALTSVTPARPTVPLRDFVRMRYGAGTELKPLP